MFHPFGLDKASAANSLTTVNMFNCKKNLCVLKTSLFGLHYIRPRQNVLFNREKKFKI